MNCVLMVSAALVARLLNIHEHPGSLNCPFVSPDGAAGSLRKQNARKRYLAKRAKVEGPEPGSGTHDLDVGGFRLGSWHLQSAAGLGKTA